MANNLTARQVQTAKPKDKLYRLSDGGNLYFVFVPIMPFVCSDRFAINVPLKMKSPT